MKTVTAVALLLLLSATSARAQARRAPVLLELPVSVRAAALGHAFPLGSVDANAIFHNAAFGESLRGMAATAHSYDTRSTVYSAAGGMEWWGGSVALGLQAASYAPEAAALGEAAGQFFGTGPTPVAETAASLAFSRRVRGIRFGATGKWLEQRTGVERNSTVAVDVATGLNVGPVLLGLSVQNLGPRLEVGGRDVPLPDRVTVGAAMPSPLPVGPLDLLAAVALGRDSRGDVFAGGGLEVSWWPVVGRTFTARAGAVTRGPDPAASPVTLGAGFTGDRIGIDYAFQSFGDRGDVHRIGLRWR